MPKKTDRTTDKLNKLETFLGELSLDEEEALKPSKKEASFFKTSEVVILLIITLFVSLITGAFITYKFAPINGEAVDEELSEFINNYEYITKNYNGKIDKKELMDTALDAMLQKLDQNSVYMDQDSSKNLNILLEGKYSGLGIQVYGKDDKLIIAGIFKNSPASKADLRAGDIITKLNDKSVKGLPGDAVSKLIKDNKKDVVTITYIRDKKEKTAKAKLGTVNIESVISKTYEKSGKKIGYIAVGIFASNSYKQFKSNLDKLEKAQIDSLVIDLRSNHGGYLYVAENIISLFLDSNHVIYQIQKNGEVARHYSKWSRDKGYKIIVLVDGNSASASEVVASALKEQLNAKVVGKKTYGKGTVQEMQNLSSGDKYKITTKNWLTSKGVWVEGKGIEPDIKIDLDDKYFDDPKEANDNQLQKALDEACK